MFTPTSFSKRLVVAAAAFLAAAALTTASSLGPTPLSLGRPGVSTESGGTGGGTVSPPQMGFQVRPVP